MSNWKLFIVSVLSTACVMSALLYVQRPRSRPVLLRVNEDGRVYVSPQISARDVGYMARRYGIQTIVDMRPDGEAPDEPSHLQIEQVAKAEGLGFRYIPVPHESIPPATVSELGGVLSSFPKPVMLYCRTGRRAIRTFALSEASRGGGPDLETILDMVGRVGFSAEDLRAEIAGRIAARSAAAEVTR